MAYGFTIPTRASLHLNGLPKPFPWVFSAVSGFLVFYFLYFFEAFGIDRGYSYSGHSHLFRSVSFGILTIAILTLFEVWLKPKWMLASRSASILWLLIILFVGSQCVFLLFNFYWDWQEWTLDAYWLILKEFSAMMVLPLSFSSLIQKIWPSPRVDSNFITFQSENRKDQLSIDIKDFIYANASGNYITIAYRSSGEQVSMHLIRKPLKTLEQELKGHPEIVRTYRSYIVNRRFVRAVKHVKGKVIVDVGGTGIPVSKQYRSLFLKP